jgi:tricorn protease-like protein
MNSAQYIREIKVLSASNSDTLVIVSYVTSSLSIFYGKLSRSATLKVDKNAKYLKLDNDSITYDLHKDIKICRLLYP